MIYTITFSQFSKSVLITFHKTTMVKIIAILTYPVPALHGHSRGNKCFSFIKITNALDKTKNQDEYNIYVSMLDEEELECLKYVQRPRKYTNRQLLASPTDTDESKPEKNKGGRKKNVADDDAIMSEPITPEEPTPPPSPAYCFTIF